jgi:hypothetical protein
MSSGKLFGGSPSMPRSVRDDLAKKTGQDTRVGINPGQISGLARNHNNKAWAAWASANSGGRDYDAGNFREGSETERKVFEIRNRDGQSGGADD